VWEEHVGLRGEIGMPRVLCLPRDKPERVLFRRPVAHDSGSQRRVGSFAIRDFRFCGAGLPGLAL